MALIVLQTINFPKPKPSYDQIPPDSMHKILGEPNFLIAVLGAIVAYAVMNILMTCLLYPSDAADERPSLNRGDPPAVIKKRTRI